MSPQWEEGPWGCDRDGKGSRGRAGVSWMLPAGPWSEMDFRAGIPNSVAMRGVCYGQCLRELFGLPWLCAGDRVLF